MLKRFRLTWLQIAVHLGGILPLVILVRDYLTHNLTYNPIQAATQRTGDTAITLLVLSLACTPFHTLTGYADVLRRRKAIGLYAFLYASIHFLIFIGWDYGFNWLQIWQDTNTKPYVFAGLGALLILIPLAITSFRWWMKHLGKVWKRLHQWVYLAGLLAVLHFAWVVKGNFLQFKGDVSRPFLYGSITVLLLGMRIPTVRRFISGLRMRLRSLRSVAKVQPDRSGWQKPTSLPESPKRPEQS
jgi:sulfoxide reductase heme-binding subunit YedZ